MPWPAMPGRVRRRRNRCSLAAVCSLSSVTHSLATPATTPPSQKQTQPLEPRDLCRSGGRRSEAALRSVCHWDLLGGVEWLWPERERGQRETGRGRER
ncbi:hypothetical protein BRADI_3g36906v3 [Brachypodium distachyon]|uniref:Secreted protein n=1 Tax=Brachypodium distachyon TaxID=15368 RepID=A0A2K2D1N9_BRADI|nr:hypothetical protein BRADI_3g36906v3 [Brachypodium distachyon]